MNEPNIADRMARLAIEAEVEVKRCLWENDADGAAAAALKGGIPPQKVDRWARDVAATQAAFAAAVEANAQLPKLEKARDEAAATQARTEAALEKAAKADAQAIDHLRKCMAAHSEAAHAIEMGVAQAMGDAPASVVPDFLKPIVEARRQEEVKDRARSNLRAHRDAIRDLTRRVEAAEVAFKASRKGRIESVFCQGGVMRPAGDPEKAELERAKKELAEMTAKIAEWEKIAAG